MNEKKAHILGGDTDNPKLISIMDKIDSLGSLAFPPVYFPDLSLKERTESPSSFVAATRDTIVPELSAPSLGCGMGIIKTSLHKEDLDKEFFKEFYDSVQDELGKSYNFFENVSVWLGLRKRKLKKYDLSKNEFEEIIRHGARAAVKRYGYDESLLNNIENKGSVYTRDELKNLNLHDILPRSSFTNGRHDLGYGFKGNHFLEFQFVEEVLDTNTANSLGLEKGQVVIMYHGGGGMVPYHVGRYYANRKKNTFKQKMFLFVGKSLFHFASLRGIKNAKERFHYYFRPHPFQEIPLNSQEGKRIMLANKASLNYSYAFNVAISRRVSDALAKTFPNKNTHSTLIMVKIHNSILKESINGESVVVHRHTANKVLPGMPSFISGFNNTNSYIVVGDKNTEKYLNSIDHGSGSVIEKFENNEISKKHPSKFKTVVFTTKPPFQKTVPHITSEGVDYVIEKLRDVGIIKPAIKLRPVAVFKG